ncbi:MULTISPECIES: N-acetylmuramoyl-L-alanine amidase [unclassified Saccharicrinis]|uniref:N-acetylmuramoyl-L-alanine amidase n=1 Tax=unclassified Saccharicrinis TaxID=2646859 RepID=UPI003D33C4BD
MVRIVLHCSDSAFGNAALIAKWHSLPAKEVVQNGKKYKGRGWSGIGYHYVILNGWLASNIFHPKFDGYVETGRPLDDDLVVLGKEVGAHVKGYNSNSVGICLIGKSGQFTEAQMNTSLRLIYDLELQFHDIDILQHSNLDQNKPHCAGLDLTLWRNNYEKYKSIVG